MARPLPPEFTAATPQLYRIDADRPQHFDFQRSQIEFLRFTRDRRRHRSALPIRIRDEAYRKTARIRPTSFARSSGRDPAVVPE
jgi:hypothetical protein